MGEGSDASQPYKRQGGSNKTGLERVCFIIIIIHNILKIINKK